MAEAKKSMSKEEKELIKELKKDYLQYTKLEEKKKIIEEKINQHLKERGPFIEKNLPKIIEIATKEYEKIKKKKGHEWALKTAREIYQPYEKQSYQISFSLLEDIAKLIKKFEKKDPQTTKAIIKSLKFFSSEMGKEWPPYYVTNAARELLSKDIIKYISKLREKIPNIISLLPWTASVGNKKDLKNVIECLLSYEKDPEDASQIMEKLTSIAEWLKNGHVVGIIAKDISKYKNTPRVARMLARALDNCASMIHLYGAPKGPYTLSEFADYISSDKVRRHISQLEEMEGDLIEELFSDMTRYFRKGENSEFKKPMLKIVEYYEQKGKAREAEQLKKEIKKPYK